MEIVGNIIAVIFQVIIGLIGLVIGLAIMPIWIDSDQENSLNVFVFVIGGIISFAIPAYFGAHGGWIISFALLGGALMFAALASYLNHKTDGAGAFGLLGYGVLIHFLSVIYQDQLGFLVYIFKGCVIIMLVIVSYYLLRFFSETVEYGILEDTKFDTTKLTGWIAIIMTILEFLNLVFGLLDKLLKFA